MNLPMVDPRQFIWQVNQTDGLEHDDSTSDPRQFIWQVNQIRRLGRAKGGLGTAQQVGLPASDCVQFCTIARAEPISLIHLPDKLAGVFVGPVFC